jgi:trypsin
MRFSFQATAIFLAALQFFSTADASLFRRQLPETEEDATAENIVPWALSDAANTIVNGNNANPGEFPWHVLYLGGVLCGGVMIHEDIALTAAHCLNSQFPPRVRIGSTTQSDGTVVEVCGGTVHPDFDFEEMENDIAILKLCTPVNTQLAQINTNDGFPTAGQQLTAMGYGRTSDEGEASRRLQKISKEYVSDAACLQRYSQHNGEFNLCADNRNGGICFGDR